jgi:putative methyltransferase (TIGR04325 family)
MDFGGSLGTSYYQCRGLLRDVVGDLRWGIVEQPHFVKCGREEFETPELTFFDSATTCVEAIRPNVLLFSGVLQFVDKPGDILNALLAHRISSVIIDRIQVLEDDAPDRLTVLRVSHEEVGRRESYPTWLFNKRNLLSPFAAEYATVLEFDSGMGRFDAGGSQARDLGFLFTLKDHG